MTAQLPEFYQMKHCKQFLGTYSKLTENCFLDYVKDFTKEKPDETQNEALVAKSGLLSNYNREVRWMKIRIHLVESPESNSHCINCLP
ncbi:mitochondrial import inner membrane translocase subunit Tim9-like [Saccopteryx leptura]|uniref:mitochondrial import inner membrane translocase subunit Tim9-like n=1 Tax=Saccopteryx leptura TaxID=249018 RepID=UPI00339C16CB